MRSIFPCLIGCQLIWFSNGRHDIPLSRQYRPTCLQIWRKPKKKGGRQTGRRTDGGSLKKKAELGLDFKVLGRYDCSSHLRRGWGERKTLGGHPIIICPTCRCDLVIFVQKPCLKKSRREFAKGERETGRW